MIIFIFFVLIGGQRDVNSDKLDYTHDYLIQYYEFEESERALPLCRSDGIQACSILHKRFWMQAVLVRLCRCPRRTFCPSNEDLDNKSMSLDNRSQLKFCKSIADLPECDNKIGLTIRSWQPHLKANEFDALHHKNKTAIPPQVMAKCRCNEPHYWTKRVSDGSNETYACTPLRKCLGQEFCGFSRFDINSIFYQCMCPLNHFCLPSETSQVEEINEILYQGEGRKTFCERIEVDSEEDDY